jgi:hypothetical protein
MAVTPLEIEAVRQLLTPHFGQDLEARLADRPGCVEIVFEWAGSKHAGWVNVLILQDPNADRAAESLAINLKEHVLYAVEPWGEA